MPVGVAVVVIIRKMGLQLSMVSKMVSQVPCEQPPSEWNFHTNSGACNLSTGRELSRSDPYSIDLSNEEKKTTSGLSLDDYEFLKYQLKFSPIISNSGGI